MVPSKFDLHKNSIILEGRSDYYILRYAAKACSENELPLLPALGAGTFGALAALHVGWNLHFLFVLDGDGQGQEERDRYVKDFGIPLSQIATLTDLVPTVTVIEDLLDADALSFIQKEMGLSKSPNKSQIKRFFQERLAAEKVEPLSGAFIANSNALLKALKTRLS